LTNFWQDVKRDLAIGRIYIPQEIMKKNDYCYEDLFDKIENENFRNVIKELVDRTEKLFDEGKGITGYVGGRLKYELKATIFGGIEVIKKIRKMDYNVLTKRPYIKNIDKLKILIQVLWK
jgi:phytoene/squalene synthetase